MNNEFTEVITEKESAEADKVIKEGMTSVEFFDENVFKKTMNDKTVANFIEQDDSTLQE